MGDLVPTGDPRGSFGTPLIPNVTPAQELALLLTALQKRQDYNKLASYWPYPKQAKFHALGAEFRERLFSASNQSGKTLAGAFEIAMHVTGRYPDWWKGKRFDKPNHGLAGSESGELTKKGVVRLLLGRDAKSNPGTGAIPRDAIVKIKWGSGVPDLPDSVIVKFSTPGGIEGHSTISFKSYDQGRSKWQADTVDWVWFDEEPPLDVYSEGITRTNVAMGPILVTFTPLQGITATVKRFVIEKVRGTIVVQMSLYEAEHYSDEQRQAIIDACPEHEIQARIYGNPVAGSGLIFPINEELIRVPAFALPDHWARINGVDFGWDHPTACAFMAWDRDADCLYVYDTYRQRKQTPVVHAVAFKKHGPWIPVAWPGDGLQTEKGTGIQLAQQYRDQAVAMLQERATFDESVSAESETPSSLVSVEAGLLRMLDRMKTGRFKVFAHLHDWWEEFRMYHRKDGKIVKTDEDLIDATRYGEMMLRFAKTKPKDEVARRPPPDWRA